MRRRGGRRFNYGASRRRIHRLLHRVIHVWAQRNERVYTNTSSNSLYFFSGSNSDAVRIQFVLIHNCFLTGVQFAWSSWGGGTGFGLAGGVAGVELETAAGAGGS